ncbi:MAG TPA: hypothetical protein VFM51_08570 [Solirubrobacterales bacterium]|nr:hypothetical protein [Solirubrobacterales bacterium]
MPRLAIATSAELPDLVPDDRILCAALESRGVEPVPVVWTATRPERSEFAGCLIRSVWDYHLRHEDFLRWLREVEAAMPLWNPLELVEWNARKGYLRDVSDWGVETIPTRWIEPAAGPVRIDELLAAEGWEEVVLKPAVDLGAVNVRRLGRGDDVEAALGELLTRGDVLVQPFLSSLEGEGELSVVCIDGDFSHAVRKVPARGDFRVQPRWGGSSTPARPAAEDLEIVERVLSRLPLEPLYARVDIVRGEGGERYLIELELIEPNLFLGECLGAAERLATAISRAL